jgi:hypothetical protein
MKHHICLVIAAALILLSLGMAPVSAAAGTSWTKSYYLSQGQGVMHEIQVDCGARLDLNSPIGGSYDLYALRNYDVPGTCPSNDYILSHYDKVARADSLGRCTMYLEQGLWCVLVQARSGSGTYVLYVTRQCPLPTPITTPTTTPTPTPTKTPVPTLTPTPTPTAPCSSPYISNEQTGLLNQGQTKVYAYRIGGTRTYIEWILTGPCGTTVPGSVFSLSQAVNFRKTFCGPDFNLYVYKDCDPRTGWCPVLYTDTKRSSNAYIGIENPSAGSTYYVLVYAQESGGSYTLKSRSYQCQADQTISM